MPCCCATNVKAAFVLGIILAVFSVLSCFNEMQGAIANGIIGAVIHCILIFGAHLTTIADPWYFWKGICLSKAHKPVTLSGNPTFTKV